MPTTTLDPGSLIASGGGSLGPGLAALAGCAILLAIVAIIISRIWRAFRP